MPTPKIKAYLDSFRCRRKAWFLNKNSEEISSDLEEEILQDIFKLEFNPHIAMNTELSSDCIKQIQSQNGLYTHLTYQGMTLPFIYQTNQKLSFFLVKPRYQKSKLLIHEARYWWQLFHQFNMPIDQVYLFRINKYNKFNETHPFSIFIKDDLTSLMIENHKKTQHFLNRLEKELKNTKPPAPKLSHTCDDCEFKSNCFPVEKDHILNLRGISYKEKQKWMNQGILKFENIVDHSLLSKEQKIQIDACSQEKVFLDKEGLKQFLSKIKYPLYFLDFEATQFVIPKFNQMQPFEPLVFMYSLHSQQDEFSPLKHQYCFISPQKDPRVLLAKQLIQDIEDNGGSIITFDKDFEVQTLKKFAALNTELSPALYKLIKRMIDLKDPFTQFYIYHPDMLGKLTFKSILPAFVKSLAYEKLSIKNGEQASQAYKSLFLNGIDYEKELIEYAKQDTYGMSVILRQLEAYAK